MSFKSASIGNVKIGDLGVGKDLLSSVKEISSLKDAKDNVKDIANIINGIEKADDVGKVLNFSGVGIDIAESAVEASRFANSMDDVMDSMKKASASSKGIQGIGTGLLGFAKSVAPTLAIITAISAGIYGIIKYINRFSDSVEKAKKSQSDYSSTVSKIQSLNSEIDTTSSKIAELEAQRPLTIVQKTELDNLRLQNAELERQRDLKQQLANSQAKQAVDDVMDSLEMKRTTDISQKTMQQQLLESDNFWDRMAASQMSSSGIPNMPYEQTDIITATKNEVKVLNDLKQTREDLLFEREKATKARKEEIDTELSGLEKEIDLYDTEVSKNMEVLQELRSNFMDKPDLTTKESQKYNDITDVIDEYLNADSLAKQTEAISKLWEDDSFSQAQQKLVDAFRSGKDLSIDDITNQFPELVSACNDAGISVSTLRDELIALASQDSGVTKLEEDFMSFQTQLISAINAVDIVNATLANSFSGKGLSVELDEETGAIIGDIADIKAAYSGLENYDASTLFEKTANGVHINREALRQLQAQQEATQKSINIQKIKDLQEQLQEATKVMNEAKTDEDFASSQLIVNDLKNQLEIAQELAAAYDGATSAYQKWINAQSNGEEGDMFRTVSETMRERGNELYSEGRYNTNEFRAVADYFSNQDLSTASIEELVRAYEAAKPTIDSFFTGNKQGIDNFMASMKQMSDKDNLGWVEELENGAMKFNVSTKELADSLGISQEAIEGLLRAADEYVPIILANDASVDFSKSIDEMQKKAEEAKSRLKELNNSGQVDLDLNFNFNSTDINDLESQIDRATSNLDKFKNQDGIVDLNIQGADDAVTILSTLIQQKQEVQSIIMTIDTSALDEGTADVVGKLQEYQAAVNQLNTLNTLQNVGVQVDTSQIDDAKSKINNIFTELQGMSANGNLQINADVSVDTSSTEALTADLAEMNPEIIAKFVPDSSEPDEYEADDKESKVKYNVDASKVNAWRPPAKTGTVTYNIRTSGSLPTNITRTVTYNTVSSGNAGHAGSGLKNIADTAINSRAKAYGTIASPAHVTGTAYNVINTIPAHADGKVALQKDERALINELGPEGLIRDGKLFWIPGGMHFQNLKKGDIILSNNQMKSLFKTGKASGTGNAYADGTISSRQLASTSLHAYVNGLGSWTFGNTGSGNIGGSGGYTGSSSSSSSSTNNSNANTSNTNTSSTAKDTKEAADASEDFKENLDAIEILISHIERKIKNIERVAGSAYNTFSKRNNALREQISSITEEISVQQKGYERYLQEAESVPLSEEYKNLIKNGAIDISTITDKDLSENINKFKEWWISRHTV